MYSLARSSTPNLLHRRRCYTCITRTMSSSLDANSKQSQQHKRYKPTSHNFQPRYTGPQLHDMTPAQLELQQSILKSRPNTGLNGPFGPWLAIPSICNPSQELGRVVRYETSLSKRESELVILLVGAKFKSESEFDIHVTEASRVGISMDVIESIPRGRLLSEDTSVSAEEDEFSLKNVENVIQMLTREYKDQKLQLQNSKDKIEELEKAKEREVAIISFAAELLHTNTVSDETYTKTKQVLDGKDSILVEITSIIGYYAYVAYTLNVFKIPTGSR